MKTLPLTKGLVAIVDDADYEYLSQFKWAFSCRYVKRSYRVSRHKTKTVYMHRVIMEPPWNLQVDHINGNTLDNRRCNLRICTRSENRRNSSVKRRSSTGIKGVFKIGNRFSVSIMTDGHRAYLGHFGTKEEAAECAKREYIRRHGEFGRQSL